MQAVLSARKYRAIHPSLVRAVAAAELAKGRPFKAAVKATKSQLHQSAAVYFQRPLDYRQALTRLQESVQAGGIDAGPVRVALRELMAGHASTRERLPLLDTAYQQIFARLPPVQSVLDVACGLHPLARPWMPLTPQVAYTAWDIFSDQIDFLNGFFQLMGYAGTAAQRDVLADVSGPPVDVAFVLKTLPCLEQLQRGAGGRLLRQIDAAWLVVSFPSQSLGGRKKGMAQNYAAYFQEQVAKTGWQVERLDFPSEQFYLVQKA